MSKPLWAHEGETAHCQGTGKLLNSGGMTFKLVLKDLANSASMGSSLHRPMNSDT